MLIIIINRIVCLKKKTGFNSQTNLFYFIAITTHRFGRLLTHVSVLNVNKNIFGV